MKNLVKNHDRQRWRVKWWTLPSALHALNLSVKCRHLPLPNIQPVDYILPRIFCLRDLCQNLRKLSLSFLQHRLESTVHECSGIQFPFEGSLVQQVRLLWLLCRYSAIKDLKPSSSWQPSLFATANSCSQHYWQAWFDLYCYPQLSKVLQQHYFCLLKVMKGELLRPTFALLKPLCNPPILIRIQLSDHETDKLDSVVSAFHQFLQLRLLLLLSWNRHQDWRVCHLLQLPLRILFSLAGRELSIQQRQPS